jgi:hypothetical protein
MKRILLFVCILAVAAVPATVSAQGLPGLGGLGSLFGSTGPCGEADPGRLVPPTFYVGWLGGGSVSIGGGLDNPIIVFTGLELSYSPNSLALGVSAPFALTDRISVIASGWWMVPATSEALDSYEIIGNREWSANTNWWWVEALAAYDLGGGFAALGGFRFDRFETKFKNARDIFILGLPVDEADSQSNAYIPLFGILYSTGSAASMLSIYAVGFPALLGTGEHNETFFSGLRLEASGDYNKGYFFETRLDYKRRVMGDADLGAFFTYNATYGKISSTATLDPGFTSAGFDGSFNRTAFILGGSLNLPFRLPFM